MSIEGKIANLEDRIVARIKEDPHKAMTETNNAVDQGDYQLSVKNDVISAVEHLLVAVPE
ncbi:MAG TPA: hypothetical protein VF884_08710 [Nitrososphaeraceae archaeon]